MNDAEPTRVLLVEDQQLIRRGLAMLLSTVDGIDVTAQAEDGRAALDILATTELDVVLVDARMPGMDGIEFTAHCTRDHPGLPVLVLTTFDDDALVQAVFSVGASGFLLKDTSIEHLVSALYSVIEGGMVIDPRVARAANEERRRGSACNSYSRRTRRCRTCGTRFDELRDCSFINSRRGNRKELRFSSIEKDW